MKKWLALLLMILLMLTAAFALADEAADITSECKLKLSRNNSAENICDRKYTTSWQHKDTRSAYVIASAPAGLPIHGVYVCFGIMPETWELQVRQNGDWVTHTEGRTDFHHVWLPVPEGAEEVRIAAVSDKKQTMCINELFFFSSGDAPAWVQQWEPTPEKADILFLSAHPDDELIFFGGGIPTYAAERGRSVIVAYLTYSNKARRSELLNGLWALGLRNYPVIGPFGDSFQQKMSGAWRVFGSEEKAVGWAVELFRRYKPEVVVTHDVDGEYGHTQHKAAAIMCQEAFDKAADETAYLESAEAWGAWKVKKLYLHLWPENQIVMDWETPLASLGGLTGLEAADQAYAVYHVTQRASGMSVSETGAKYDNHVFGLCRTRVGEDIRKNDFLENIYEAEDLPAASSTPEPTPAPTPVPTPMPDWLSSILPETDERGFLQEGEFVSANDTEGQYVYLSDTLKVVIERKYADTDNRHNLTWFEAEIWCDIGAGEMFHTLPVDAEKMGKARSSGRENAMKHQSVFATTGDYYTYRIGSGGAKHIGVEIRDGKVLYDDRYTQLTTFFPNLDTLAFFPDGRMEVFHSCEKSAEDLLDMGAYDVYSFGPYLIKDGVLAGQLEHSNDQLNPRMAVGMVEPGHYVVILCEGRIKRSSGINLKHLALLMKEKGCRTAFNLDGGRTAVMCFMGVQLNSIFPNNGSTEARQTSEIMAIGTSPLVGSTEFK